MLFCFTNNKCQMAYMNSSVFFSKIYILHKSNGIINFKENRNRDQFTNTHIQTKKLNRSIHTFVYTYGDVQLNWKMSI
jgi:hypothetical protein